MGPANELIEERRETMHALRDRSVRWGSIVSLDFDKESKGLGGGTKDDHDNYGDSQLDAHSFASFHQSRFECFPTFSTKLIYERLVSIHRHDGNVGIN